MLAEDEKAAQEKDNLLLVHRACPIAAQNDLMPWVLLQGTPNALGKVLHFVQEEVALALDAVLLKLQDNTPVLTRPL